MKDRELKTPEVWTKIADENHAQVEKWGIQDKHPFEWLAYTLEELGETSTAISEHLYRGGKASDVVKEAIHTATLAMKIAEMYMFIK